MDVLLFYEPLLTFGGTLGFLRGRVLEGCGGGSEVVFFVPLRMHVEGVS